MNAPEHPFVRRPHRTFVTLTVPVLLSLIVEPLTGLVDTFFVARLGAAPLAALGAGATLLSSTFWVFNFLGIGTQTEVAAAQGEGRLNAAREVATLALALSAIVGTGVAVLLFAGLDAVAAFMSDDPGVRADTETYVAIRLLSAPAVVVTLAAFGALRGLQDMRTPLAVAVAANAVNALLDPLLIFGAGPIPALGIAGAAWASTAALWIGAAWSVLAVRSRLGLAPRIPWRDARALFMVGRDLFFRTSLLMIFLLLMTRSATQLGAAQGSAHQAVRQIYLFSAFLLDAYAATSQSLVAYFLGALRTDLARRVAGVACIWGLASGLAITALMLLGEHAMALAFVPPEARGFFPGGWRALACAMPLGALSFVTDGIHWGARDYRYLRNAMLGASLAGVGLLLALPALGAHSLTAVWIVAGVWMAVRAFFGVVRLWPGIGAAPLARLDG